MYILCSIAISQTTMYLIQMYKHKYNAKLQTKQEITTHSLFCVAWWCSVICCVSNPCSICHIEGFNSIQLIIITHKYIYVGIENEIDENDIYAENAYTHNDLH